MDNKKFLDVPVLDAYGKGINNYKDFINRIFFERTLPTPPKENIHSKRPPPGIVPKWLWQEQRKTELLAAIVRYADGNLKIPPEWTAEFKELCDR